MEEKSIYKSQEEQRRLEEQDAVFKEYEQPVYDRLLAQKPGAVVLDVGSNNGRKVLDRFAQGRVARVIGLERQQKLVEQANDRAADRFTFFQADVEAEDFEDRLRQTMEHCGVQAFDLIHISLLLLHLKDPAALLRKLRRVLKPDGAMILVESNDGAHHAQPDEDGVMERFRWLCKQDPLAGDRYMGQKLPDLLRACGYHNVVLHGSCMHSDEKTSRMRRDVMLSIFFSFPQYDYQWLCSEYPQETGYQVLRQQAEENFAALKQLILETATEVSYGVAVLTCTA